MVLTLPSSSLCRMVQLVQFLLPRVLIVLRFVMCNVLGLPIYSVQLLRGKIPAECRTSIAVAIVIGWIATALMGAIWTLPLAPWPEGVTLPFIIFTASAWALAIMILAGILIYQRIHHGFYL